MIESFPLSWPVGFPRHTVRKISSAFKCTLGQARDGVIAEIKRLGGKQIIISSNIPVKQNGDIYASQKPVDGDHGTAVYFTWKNEQVVLACDRYATIAENLRAIQKSIDAMRGLERWGCSDILNRAFSGFKAIDAPRSKEWFDVLGIHKSSTYEEVKSAYRCLAKRYHPDNKETGDNQRFLEINEAYQIAMNI